MHFVIMDTDSISLLKIPHLLYIAHKNSITLLKLYIHLHKPAKSYASHISI